MSSGSLEETSRQFPPDAELPGSSQASGGSSELWVLSAGCVKAATITQRFFEVMHDHKQLLN